MVATLALRAPFTAFRPASSGRRGSGQRLRASQGQDNGSGGSGPVVSEDVLQRLRQAEEEAARLKKELAAAQAAVRHAMALPEIACSGRMAAAASASRPAAASAATPCP